MLLKKGPAILLVTVALAACESVPEQQLLGPDAAQYAKGPKGAWTENAPMPLPKEGTCQVAFANHIFVTHGFGPTGDSNTNQIYNISKDTWDMGAPATVIRSEGIGVAHGGRVFCIGGRGFDPGPPPQAGVLSSNEIYHIASDTWTRGAPMPTPRAGLAAAVVGNRIYAIGGRDGTAPRSGVPLDVNEVYDIATDTWSTAAPIPVPVMDVTGVAHGGRIYVAGGYNQAVCGGPCNFLQIYHAASDTWTMGAPMPTARSSLAVAVKGNALYAIAGATDVMVLTTINERYDIDKDTWSEAPPKPTATAETFANTHGDEIFVIGGGFFGAGASPVPGSVNESFRPAR